MKQDFGYYCQRIMNKQLQEKIDTLKKRFLVLPQPADKYNLIIEMGRNLLPFPTPCKTKENLVEGCQSAMYLCSQCTDKRITYQANSESLISAGLAAILLSVYNEETIETILQFPPVFLTELHIYSSLSPNRSNGLGAIYLRMKQEAVKYLYQIDIQPVV